MPKGYDHEAFTILLNQMEDARKELKDSLTNSIVLWEKKYPYLLCDDVLITRNEYTTMYAPFTPSYIEVTPELKLNTKGYIKAEPNMD